MRSSKKRTKTKDIASKNAIETGERNGNLVISCNYSLQIEIIHFSFPTLVKLKNAQHSFI